MSKLKMGVRLLVCVFAAAAWLSAADRDKPAAPSAAAPAAGGVVVFKDPATGQTRQPQPGEVRALLQKSPLSRSRLMRTEVLELQGPGRGVGMTLPESTMVSIVVTKGPDGKLSGECVGGGQKGAQDRLAAAAHALRAAGNKGASDVK